MASGPSLSDGQIKAVRAAHSAGQCRVIVTNNTHERAPWADVLYASDGPWWEHYRPEFAGQKWTQSRIAPRFGATQAHGKALDRISFDPACIHNGRNTGFQALNLAVLFGAGPVVLLGYDMQATGGQLHWHRDHDSSRGCRLTNPCEARFDEWRGILNRAARDLEEHGIRCINATSETALTGFERMTIDEALAA